MHRAEFETQAGTEQYSRFAVVLSAASVVLRGEMLAYLISRDDAGRWAAVGYDAHPVVDGRRRDLMIGL